MCENREQEQAKTKFPLALLGHSDSWQRLAVHIWHRCSHGGGLCLAPKYLSFGNEYAELFYLPTPQQFITALADEVVELATAPLREIATIEPPAEFTLLWDVVLKQFSAPAA